MMRFWLYIALLGLFVASLGPNARVSAQAPDIRNIRPHVMLLVDTSGSMERKPNCLCTTPACLECLPVCGAGTYEQNRWSVVAQALTGEFTPYECNSDLRIGGIYTGQYDEGYFLPHIQLPQEIPTYFASGGSQSANGVLDTYIERIKFGLMTFDSIGTLSDRPPLVSEADFLLAPFPAESTGTKGMFSYGPDAPFSFPGALTTFMINSGARSESAPEGGLVSVGADSTASMATTNAAIQATVLGDSGLGKYPLRPYGATPTAGLVTDLQVFLQSDPDIIQKTGASDPGDPYYGCRLRSAVLITDGFPNGDMRGNPVNCQDFVGAPGCPYNEVADTVAAMVASDDLDKFYVIGFALDGDAAKVAAVEALLNDVASVGDTTEAFLVADRAELVTALSFIFNEQNPGAASRTAPVLTGASPGLFESEFISGFNVSLDSTDPWDGVLERRRFECVGGLPEPQDVEDRDRFQEVLNAQNSAPSGVEPWGGSTKVNFTGGFPRNLWTVLPNNPADINSHLTGSGRDKLTTAGLDVPGVGGALIDQPAGEFSRAIDPAYLLGVGSTDNAFKNTVVEWVHGAPGSGRENERLGDIYHSTPAIVGPLVDDIDDSSFNDWRLGLNYQLSPDSAEPVPDWQLSERPRVIYASSNDGVIHAFLADDYLPNAYSGLLDEFACADGKDAGTELWGFIPPMFLDDLDDMLAGGSKQWYGDGSIQVRNLYDVREFAADEGGATNAWRTVLFLSFRNGGNGMVALDVTNPCKPEFLWQFTHPNLAATYGQPTAAQILVKGGDDGSGGPAFLQTQSRGVILLPGGQGVEDGGACPIGAGAAPPEGMTEADDVTNISPRPNGRCWRDETTAPPEVQHGRMLYFIDMLTGSLIEALDQDTFPAPLTGAVSVYRGDTGAVARAAYTVDADGALWRVDLSSPEPADWTAEVLHDLYYDEAFDVAEPTFYPPALTRDPQGRVVILTGTGNIDVLDDPTAINKVVSVTEKLTFNTDGTVDKVEGRLNWEIDELESGEQMTGPIELFGGQVFFGTFKSASGTAIDACPFGGSRIFGLNYLDNPLSPGDPLPLLGDDPSARVLVFDQNDLPQLENALLVGLQVAQAPVCVTVQMDTEITDPFDGTSVSLAMPVAASSREFKLMGHLSGSAGVPVNQLAINILEQGIQAPQAFTVVSGMADTLE
ncbi:MAG: hypothetical protein WBM26_09980 [Polyangiales bacterium]